MLNYTSGEKSNSENLILAAGERLSALAVAHRLRQNGLRMPLSVQRYWTTTEGSRSSKEIDIISSKQQLDIESLVEFRSYRWFGEGDDGNIALLTRGVLTICAAFANLTNASKLILWKDIDGIKRLNPRWGIEYTYDTIPRIWTSS